MSAQDTLQSQDSMRIWNFIRLDQFRLPPELTREKVRRDFLGIWDRLVRGRSKDKSPALEIDLIDIPSNLLAESAPAPDWREGVPVLDEVLQDWWQERSGRIQILVGAPYSGTAEIVAHWAAVKQCPVLPDPPLDQIKSGGGKWLEQIDQSLEGVWVIPHLERFYLRHAQGLAMFRALLDKITTSPTRFLLGCDSWAWAYLSKALHLNALFPMPLVLEAFNSEKLENWFGSLAARSLNRGFTFRQADTGNPVLTTAAVSEKMGKKEKGTSDFLVRLAAFSRGIPGVAYDIWRYSLRLAHEAENQEMVKEVASDDAPQQLIWVEPWAQLKLPSMASLDSRARDLFVLHTLLLHDGLSCQVLAQVLPFSEPQVKNTLQLLEVAGVVVSDQDNWRVAAKAYPAVRQFLQYEGYFVDIL